MVRAIILLTLAACASSKSAEQHAEVGLEAHGAAHAEEQTAASGRTTAGPETITTTVEEFAPLAQEEDHAAVSAGVDVGSAAGGRGNRVAGAGNASGLVLARRTVTVDQRGPVDSSWMANASGTQGAEERSTLGIRTESRSSSKWRFGPSWIAWTLIAIALGVAWKTGWLGKGLGLLGRIF